MTAEAKGAVTVLYFARLGEQLGARQEVLNLPAAVTTAGALQAFLAKRDGAWSNLKQSDVRVAVNHEIAGPETRINPGDEVAFFPPVTGG